MSEDEVQPDTFEMPTTKGGILSLKEINGIPIEQIETNMQPGEISFEGFLGENERLIDVLMADFKAVQRLGVSNQDIGYAINYLFIATNYPPPPWQLGGRPSSYLSDLKHKLFDEGVVVELYSKRFLVELHTYERNPYETRVQKSPMGDDYEVDAMDIRVIDMDAAQVESLKEYNDGLVSGKIPFGKYQRKYANILPYLISQYGFYEGKESPYRHDPEDIVSFLNIPRAKSS